MAFTVHALHGLVSAACVCCHEGCCLSSAAAWFAALDAHVAVLIYNKMAERGGARFLADVQAALFSRPSAGRPATLSGV